MRQNGDVRRISAAIAAWRSIKPPRGLSRP